MRKRLDLREKLKKLTEGEGEEELALKAKRPPAEAVEEVGLEYKPAKERPIRDFEVPANFQGLTSVSAFYDEEGIERLEQLLAIQATPDTALKWTVMRDPYAEKLTVVVQEGLVQIKTHPSIFAAELKEAVLLTAHLGRYTFVLGCTNLDLDSAAEVFIALLRHMEEVL